MKTERILLTGAAGYIGSHVAIQLKQQGYENVHYIDNNFYRSPNTQALQDLEPVGIHNYDILEDGGIDEVLDEGFDVIIHLAALISVEESVRMMTQYWRNNLLSTYKLIENEKKRNKSAHFIFASTGTAFCPENPYAWSKVACEEVIRDSDVDHTIFRFYNVSGLSYGLQPTGEATHLIRRAAMAARGMVPEMKVFGTDWNTPDGTAVRDYIHVEDIARSIVNAVKKGPTNHKFDCLGSGTGYSVLEVVTSMKKVSGVDFQVTMAPRRAGDVASMVCPVELQYEHLIREHDLDSMCLSAYKGLK